MIRRNFKLVSDYYDEKLRNLRILIHTKMNASAGTLY